MSKRILDDKIFDIRLSEEEKISYERGDSFLDEDGLTMRMREWVENYCSDPQHDPVKAMIKIGVSPEKAGYEAKKIIVKPVVIYAIKKRMKESLEEHKITINRIIEEYANIAFARVTDFYTYDKKEGVIPISDFEKLSEQQKSAISEFSVKVDKETGKKYISKVFLHDKLRALEALGRYAGIFEKDNKQKVVEGVKIEDVLNGIKASNPELEDAVRRQLASKLLTDPNSELNQNTKH
jgi:phage terminase small subunit